MQDPNFRLQIHADFSPLLQALRLASAHLDYVSCGCPCGPDGFAFWLRWRDAGAVVTAN